MMNSTTISHDLREEFGGDEVAIEDWVKEADCPFVRRNRKQLLESFPLLVPVLARGIDRPNYACYSTAVDSGFPLIDTFKSHARINKATARFLRGKPPSLVGKEWATNPLLLFRIIDSLPRNIWPTSRLDWYFLNYFWSETQRATNSSNWGWERKALRWHIFSGLCSAGFLHSRKKWVRLWPESSGWDEIREFIECMEIWCWHHAGKMKFNSYLAAAAEVKLASDLLMRYQAGKILELSKRWHYISKRNSFRGTGMQKAHWPALLPTPFKVDSLSVISLTSSAHLQEESDYLEHCASKYTERCLFGVTHLLSIRNIQGAILSTAEVSLPNIRKGVLKPVLLQHYGKRNTDPPAECKRALAFALKAMEDQASPFWIGNIVTGLLQWQADIALHLKDCGEVTVYDGIQAVMEETLPDYTQAVAWLTRRLEEEEGLYRYRQDRFEQGLKKLGLGDEYSVQRLVEVGFFDPTIFEEFEELELKFLGNIHQHAHQASNWKFVSFWRFHSLRFP